MAEVAQVGKIAPCVGPSLFPIAQMLDELRAEDVATRANAVRGLDQIAQALGPERTREELIPFVGELLDDEDEVLEALADVLGQSLGLVGAAHAEVLLRPLESLARVEELATREKAVAAIQRLIAELPPDAVTTSVLPVVQRLATQDWYTGVCSACSLLGSVLPRVAAPAQEELFRLFGGAATDENLVVRRQAAHVLGELATHADPSRLPYLLNLLTKVSRDEQMSVRSVAPRVALELAAVVDGQAWFTHVFPTVQVCAEDNNPRVRSAVLTEFVGYLRILQGRVAATLLPICLRLLADPEPDLRAQACGVAKSLLAAEPAQGAVALYEPLKKLARDSSDDVRIALAEVVLTLAPLLGPQRTVEHLLNTALQLLRDENPTVRLAVLETLPEIASVISVDMLAQSVQPAVTSLASERAWRVRAAVLRHAPAIAMHIGEPAFTLNLAPQVLGLVEDRVAMVRAEAANCYAALGRAFGPDWVREHLAPRLRALQDSAACQRIAALQCCGTLVEVLDARTSHELLLPTVFKLVQDPVPNVRLNVCKILTRLARALPEDPSVAALARELAHDPDADTAALAQVALAAR